MEKAISWLMANPVVFAGVIFVVVVISVSIVIAGIESLTDTSWPEWPDKIRAKFGREENTNHREEKVR